MNIQWRNTFQAKVKVIMTPTVAIKLQGLLSADSASIWKDLKESKVGDVISVVSTSATLALKLENI